MKTGEKIRRVRELRGMTERELGLKCGFGKGKEAKRRIVQYENGIREPKEAQVRRIASALGVSPAALLVTTHDPVVDLVESFFWKEEEDPDGLMCAAQRLSQAFTCMEYMQKRRAEGFITREQYLEWKLRAFEYEEG